MKGIHIGEVLVEQGAITKEQLNEGLKLLKAGTNDRRLAEVLTDLGYITERELLDVLGRGMGLEVIDLEFFHIDERAVEKIPKQLALKYTVMAVSMEGSGLTVATADPLDLYALEDIRLVTNMRIQLILVERTQIRHAIELNYSGIDARAAARLASEHAVFSRTFAENLMVNSDEDQAPIVRLLNSLLLKGYNTNASDIHIEPFKDFTQVRMRIDGQMVSYLTLEKALHNSIVARIKIMSNLNIAEKRIPQDGNFHAVLEGIDISMRISVLPTTHGEKIVMRYLVSDTKIDHAGHFGMNEYSYNMLMKMMSAPNGIIYITGPTGSGKTTTLYMVLQHLSQRPVNISTIEDPVEKDLPNITQTSVNVTAGMTFAVGLRALLRQDPDIIMIGETRDAETAEISVRSAITGHLVVSTLHTNDAISSIVRLADMGVAPYLISNSVVGIVAQRLVRKVCQFCKYEEPATADDIAIVGDGIPMITRGKGCKVCNNTGYKGRISIHEMVYIDKTLKRMIAKSADSQEMLEYAKKTQGMRSLLDSAIDLVKEGVTTPEEVMKIAYYSD